MRIGIARLTAQLRLGPLGRLLDDRPRRLAREPGTAPPDSYSVIGSSDQQQAPQQEQPGYVSGGGGGGFGGGFFGGGGASPDQDRAVRRGTGLY